VAMVHSCSENKVSKRISQSHWPEGNLKSHPNQVFMLPDLDINRHEMPSKSMIENDYVFLKC